MDFPSFVTEIELSEIGHDQRGVFAVAQGWLWIDGVRVYHATDLAMRIVPRCPRAILIC